jgi:hypothetical protein
MWGKFKFYNQGVRKRLPQKLCRRIEITAKKMIN